MTTEISPSDAVVKRLDVILETLEMLLRNNLELNGLLQEMIAEFVRATLGLQSEADDYGEGDA